MTRYAVIGKPVNHSKSPQIHQLFAAQTGEAVEYSAIEVEAGELASFIRDFFASGGGGLNVTVPYKEEVFALADSLSDRARRARAVNTLWLEADNKLFGDNTDGIGLLRDIRDNHGFEVQGARVLLLGAGGAARGAMPALLEAGVGDITIANRTLAKAQQLGAEFAGEIPVAAVAYEALAGSFELVINATSLSLAGELPPLPETVAVTGCCYDMMYGDGPTVFQDWAAQRGATLVLDGLGMLVEQAAEAFYQWRGVRPPDTGAVIARLRT